MLDEGLKFALEHRGFRARVVGYVERESYAATTLLARMEEQSVEPAPIWCGDMAEFPAEEFYGMVDFVVGGIPCQPFSVAGKQKRTEDARWLWPLMRDIAGRTGARGVAIENVGGFIHAGLEPVLNDFAESGWTAEWLHLRASEVGANHQRERIFLLGVDVAARQRITGRAISESNRWIYDTDIDGRSAELAHAERQPGSTEQLDQSGERRAPGAEHIAMSGGVGAELALAPSGGFGELREPSGGNGQPDGECESMANPIGERIRGGDIGGLGTAGCKAGELQNREGVANESGNGGEAVEYTSCGCDRRGQQDGSETLQRDKADYAGGTVGHTESYDQQRDTESSMHRERKQVRGPSGVVEHTERASGGPGLCEDGAEFDRNRIAGAECGLDNSNGQGLQERSGEHGNSGEERPSIERDCLPLFAPGPQSKLWGTVVANAPHLAPAIEPGLRVLVDGLAYVVDESRADQLQCAGNGVVALQAAVAFAVLLGRLGVTAEHFTNQPQ